MLLFPILGKSSFGKKFLIKIIAIDPEIVFFSCRPSALFTDLFPRLYSLDLKPRPLGKMS
jgi:hypothetical protein